MEKAVQVATAEMPQAEIAATAARVLKAVKVDPAATAAKVLIVQTQATALVLPTVTHQVAMASVVMLLVVKDLIVAVTLVETLARRTADKVALQQQPRTAIRPTLEAKDVIVQRQVEAVRTVMHQAETASVAMQQAVKVLTVVRQTHAMQMVQQVDLQQLLKMVIKPIQVAKVLTVAQLSHVMQMAALEQETQAMALNQVQPMQATALNQARQTVAMQPV